jgi:hypothetical protein
MSPELLIAPKYSEAILNTPGLLRYWRMRGSVGTPAAEEKARTGLTLVASPPVRQGTPVDDGAGVKFNGTSQAASVALDLSGTPQISLSFLMWWDAFANNDKLMAEYSADYNASSGLLVDPNSNSGLGSGKFEFGTSLLPGPFYWLNNFTRPSAAAWHHYVLTMDRANKVNTAYVDGATASGFGSGIQNGGVYGNFANSSLYLMSRNTTALFGAGRLSELALFSGILSAGQARAQSAFAFGA